MPEGPELRVDAEQLDFFLSERMLESIEFVNDKFEDKCEGLEDIVKELPLQIDRVRSKAKQLFIFFKPKNPESKPWVIFITYGMTGNITLHKETHSHIRFSMSKSHIGFNEFFYTDQRRIGSFAASNDPDELKNHLETFTKPVVFGYDEPGFASISKSEFIANIESCGDSYLASRIMNQRSICSGVGNYILSESFYEAKLDPFVCCDEMTTEQCESFWNALHKVMNESFERGGMSMTHYSNPTGAKGTFGELCKVYNKENQMVNGHKVHSCKGPHGRTIWFTEENGNDTLGALSAPLTPSP